ncbi:MarC family protein [Faunimonas pinastri]|uniref:MarC family protein n=1 Tax=Faunimonas pinastri TaxID=1855383 RepID=UPI001EEB4938|nr:MarC family protein [Faunimonas pinastri]
MHDAISSLVTLFVTIDPAGLAPLFVALTAGMSRSEQLQVTLRGSITAFCILVVFALAGTAFLEFFGITIHAFRIAGGLLLFTIAFEMIFERRQERHEKSASNVDRVRSLAVFPLAIPLIAGPGAISATILLAGTYAQPVQRVELILILAVAIVITGAVLLVSPQVDRFLGSTGRIVVTRLLGLILAALAVQFVADGVMGFVRLFTRT